MEPLLGVAQVTLLVAAAVATTGLGVVAARHRETPGARPFTGLMAALTVWTLGYAVGLTVHPGGRLLWERIQWLGIVFVPVCFLLFALEYLGYGDNLRRYGALAAIPSVAMLVWVWTNPIHRLVWVEATLHQTGGVLLVEQEFGLAYWVFLAYAYALIAVGSYLLARVAINSEYLYLDQSVALLAGIAVPLVANLVSVVGRGPLPGIDLTPYAFSVTGIMFGNALFRYRLFERVPASWQLGRESVVGNLRDGVVVIDTDRTVVYCNDAAADIFDVDPSAVVGASIDVLGDVDPVAFGDETTMGELDRDGGTYEVRVSPVVDRHDRGLGHTLVVNDISGRKRRERELAEQRDELLLANRLNAVMRSVNEVLIAETTRSGLLEAAAAALAESELYAAAWAVEETLVDAMPALDAEVRPGAQWEPTHREEFDGGTVVQGAYGAGRSALAGAESTLPVEAGSVAEDLDDDAEGLWTTLPVVHGQTAYGSIVLFSTRSDAFDERELAVLDELGRQIGHAVNAVEKELLLVSDAVTELELTATGDDPLAEASRVAGCTLRVEGLVPAADDEILAYCAVEGTDVHEATAALSRVAGITGLRPIDEEIIECRLGGATIAVPLREVGAQLDDIVATGGTVTVTARVAPDADVRAIVDRVQHAVPATELQAKRRREGPLDTDVGSGPGGDLADRLTDRQRETLEAAYSAGYFEWPRESTAEDVADAMGVSSPTVHNHLRKAENEVLGALLEDDRTEDRSG